MPVRMAKRSHEACAISNVPELSWGFMVPMQKNGRGNAWRRLPTVTACSSIASRRPDCMRGVARLNSSRTTALANSGPGMNSSGREQAAQGEGGRTVDFDHRIPNLLPERMRDVARLDQDSLFQQTAPSPWPAFLKELSASRTGY